MACWAAAQTNKIKMTYLALARKFRPNTFAELIGQDHVKRALMNSLDSQRLHHAYLFTGTRGVGKTSIARLFAKSLNCIEGISATPCLRCDNCKAVAEGACVDLLEVDAASRTGVDDTRQLLENVPYLPSSGRYKIYLIDEVHMLSTSSFNALLKTLEEPPAHVIFMLATTDPQKIPVTVLSRCLQFHLQHVSTDNIQHQLASILEQENFAFETSALALIAEAASGSLRDALSLLDQALVSTDNQVSTEVVSQMLGYTQKDYALLILQALQQKNAHDIVALSEQLHREGGQFQYITDRLQRLLHQIMRIQQLDGSVAPLESGDALTALANAWSKDFVQLLYQIALKGAQDMHFAPNMGIGFEVTLLRMLAFHPVSTTTQVLPLEETPLANTPPRSPMVDDATKSNTDTVSGTHSTEKRGTRSSSPPPITTEHDAPSTAQKPLGQTPIAGEGEARPISNATSDDKIAPPVEAGPPSTDNTDMPTETPWMHILRQLALRGLALSAAQNAVMHEKTGSMVTLTVAPGHASLFTPSVKEKITEALSGHFTENIRLAIQTSQDHLHTPALQTQHNQKKAQQAAEQNLADDKVFQSLQDNFAATVVADSIESLKDEL